MSAERVVSEHDESMVAPELPTVSVILPVLNEAAPARALPACRCQAELSGHMRGGGGRRRFDRRDALCGGRLRERA